MSKAGFALDVAGFGGTLSRIASAIPPTGRSNMQVAVLDLEREIKERSPVDTGHLRASYEGRVESASGDRVVGVVGSNVPYAPYQEYLHRPHVRPAVEARRDSLVKIMASDTLAEAISHVG